MKTTKTNLVGIGLIIGSIFFNLSAWGAVSTLVAYYPFENSFADTSGNGLSTTFSGSASYTTGPTGLGSALNLDGSSYVEIAYTPSFDFGNGAFTLSAWIKPNSLPGDMPIISRWGEAWDLRLGWGGDVSKLYTFLGSDPPSSAGPAIETGVWTQIYVRRDDAAGSLTGTPNQLSFFVNGVRYDAGSNGKNASGLNPVRIGGFVNYSQRFQGGIDEVKIYNSALSDDAIQNVPEPSIAALLGGGLILLGSIQFLRRFR